MTYNNNTKETTITITILCTMSTATAVSPPQAGGSPTQAQTDALDDARVPRRGVHAVLECCAQAPCRAAQESHWTRVYY